jgi:tetratricopeptide (TPR) repeat protein
MFEYKGSEKFDVGKSQGEYEYDFFTIKNEEDFLALMNHYELIFKRFNYYLDRYKIIENNSELSPVVQAKMKEHEANICLTFFVDEYMKNNIGIKELVVNEKKLDGTYNMHSFFYYYFEERNALDYLERGLAYAQSELHNAAIKYYSEGIILEPGIIQLYYLRGISYHKIKNFEQAISDLSKVIELDPTAPTFYSLRGFIFKDINENSKAISDLSKAIELDPTESSFYSMRGSIFKDMNNIERAKEDISKALELNPKDKLAKKCLIELSQQ